MEMETELKNFFESSPLAQKAADSIKDGREIGITLTDSTGAKKAFTFARESKKNVFRAGAPQSADLAFQIPEVAAKELVTREFSSVGQVGLHIFEKMLSNDPAQKIQAKVNAGVLSLVMGGYLGILTSGGSEVAKFLASKGLGNMSKLKDAISKLRG